MSRPTYLNRAYDVINNLGLTGLSPHHRNDIAVAFSEVLEEVEAAALARAARYMRSAAAPDLDAALDRALAGIAEVYQEWGRETGRKQAAREAAP